MAYTVNDVKKRIKEREEGRASLSSSASKGSISADDVKRRIAEREFGKLSTSLNSANDTINKAYSGWNSAEDMASFTQSLSGVNKQLNDYTKKYGSVLNAEQNKALSSYTDAINGLSNLTDLYGYYQNADAFNAAMEKQKNAPKKVYAFDKYRGLMSNEDFETNSSATRSDFFNKNLFDQLFSTSKEREAARNSIDFQDQFDRANINLADLTDEQQKVAQYIYNTKGADAFKDYMMDISSDAIIDRYNRMTDDYKAWALEHPLLAGAKHAVMGTLATPVASAQTAVQTLVGGQDEANQYDAYAGYLNMLNEGEAAVVDNLKTKYGTVAGMNIPSLAYEAYSSGLANRIGQRMFGDSYTAIMSMGSALSTYTDAVNNGLDPVHAVAKAGIAGLVEFVTEKVGMEKAFGDAGKNFVTNMLKSAGAEGAEEIVGDIANNFFDLIINQDNSDLAREYNEYVERGFDKSDAFWKTAGNTVSQTLEGALAAALSTVAEGGVHTARTANLGSKVNGAAFSDAIKGLDEGSKVVARNEELKKEFGEDLSNRKGFSDNWKVGANYLNALNESETSKAREGETYGELVNRNTSTYLKIKSALDSKPMKKSKTFNVGEKSEDKEGNAIQVADVYTDDEGKTVIQTPEGNTVSADDATLTLNDMNIAEVAKDIQDAEFRKAYLEGYNGQDVSRYNNVVRLIQSSAQMGLGLADVMEYDVTDVISKDQVKKLYTIAALNKKNADAAANREVRTIDEAWAKKFEKPGTFDTSALKGVNLTSNEKRFMQLLGMFSKLGMNIRVISDSSSKSENGSYDKETNTLTINLKARYTKEVRAKDANGQYVVSTFAHESTHWMENILGDEFETFKDVLKEYAGENQWKAWMAQEYRNSKGKLDIKGQESEVVARMCEDMLNNPDMVDRIVAVADQSKIQKIIKAIQKWFSEIKADIKRLMEGYSSDTEEAKFLADNLEKFEEVQNMWVEMFQRALVVNQVIEYTDNQTESKQFSIKASVETSENLMALHNLNEEELVKTIKLGGFALPSIAIKKQYMPHTDFGNVTIVFSKDTVDPSKTDVYSSDAYTVSFPRIEKKLSEKKVAAIRKKIEDIVGGREEYNKIGHMVSLDYDNMTDFIERRGTAYEAYKDEKAIKYAYLKSKGEDISIPMKDKKYLQDLSNEALGAIALTLGNEELTAINNNGYSWFKDNADEVDRIKVLINEAFYREHERDNISPKLQSLYKNYYSEDDGTLSWSTFDKVTRAMNRLRNGGEQIVDTDAFDNMLKEYEYGNDYKEWIENLFDGVVEKEGFRNNVDYFTPSGNRRSWEALHWELNLENVVKWMKSQPKTGADAFFGADALFGVSTVKFKDMEDMKKRLGQLYTQKEEERDAQRKEFFGRLSDICDEIVTSDSFIAKDGAGEAIVEAIQHAKTVSGIDKYMRKNFSNFLNIKDDTAQKVYDLYQDILKMPTEYFEAKPSRAVGLDEIAYAVVPSDISKKTIELLNENNIAYKTYKPGDNEDRVKVVNENADVANGTLFSNKVDSEGNALSEGQVKYFERSKVRDAQGNLIKVYHGSQDYGFTVFYTTSTNEYGVHFGTKAAASTFADEDHMYSGYLNIENPIRMPDIFGDVTKLSDYVNMIHGRRENLINGKLTVGTTRKEVEFINTKEEFPYNEAFEAYTQAAQDFAYDDIGDAFIVADYARAYLASCGYDGVIYQNSFEDKGSDSYMALYEEQFKNADNLNPTKDKDVRYSSKVGEENYSYDSNDIVVISPTSFVKHDFDKRIKATKEDIYNYLSQLNGEKVTIASDGRLVFFDNDGAWEYTHSKSNERAFTEKKKAKAEATRAIKKIVETAYYKSWRENTETNKYKKDSQRGMLHYSILFGIGDVNPIYYSGNILIRQSSDGNDYVYDFVNIKEQGQLSALADVVLASVGIVQRSGNKVNGQLANGQTISSAGTSQKQNASTFNTYQFKEGERVLDWGGGSWDISRMVVSGSYDDVKIEAVDAFNRTAVHNKRVLDEFKADKATSITINNVLNVIDSYNSIKGVLADSKKYLKKNGMCYIHIYTGDGSGNGKTTKAGYQRNQKASAYVNVVKMYYKNVVLASGDFILASDGKIDVQKLDAVHKERIKQNTNNVTRIQPQYLDMRDSLFSQKVDLDTADILGQKKRLEKENAKLKADVKRLALRLSLEGKATHGLVLDDRQLELAAKALANDVKSTYDKAELKEDLRRYYGYILEHSNQEEELNWDEVMGRAYEIAAKVMEKAKPEKIADDYYKMILNDIRGARIKLTPEQIQEAKNQYGDDWRKAFLGRILIANDGRSLDSYWSEWSSMYPGVFNESENPTDQIIRLSEIYDDMKDASVTLRNFNDAESVRAEAIEIYNKFWTVDTVRTTTDKYTAQIKKLKFEHRQAMDELRKSSAESIKQLKASAAEDKKNAVENQRLADTIYYQGVINKLRADKNQKLSEYKEYVRNQKLTQKEAAERRALVNQITDTSKTLMDWMRKNNGKTGEAIPEALKVPVSQLLNAIDYSSKQYLGLVGGKYSGVATRKDISLRRAIENINKLVSQSTIDGFEELGMYVDFPPNYQEDLAIIAATVNAISARIGNDNVYVLNEMTSDELEGLYMIVKTMKKTIQNLNRRIADANARTIAATAQESILELNELGLKKYGLGDKLKSFINWKNTLPVYAFKHMGKGAYSMFEELQDGWDKFAFNIQTIKEYAEGVFNGKQRESWSKEVKDFDILVLPTEAEEKKGGSAHEEHIQMTVSQIMSLYCLSKREHAIGHIANGGIKIRSFGEGKNKVVQNKNIRLSKGSIEQILSSLTEEQKEVADKLQEFMNTTCSDWGNEVSMKRYGIKGFTEKHYFPIKVDSNVLASEGNDKEKSLYALLNMSFTKPLTERASNQIEIGDIFDVFTKHTSEMAKYNAMALPLLDTIKWYNYKEKDVDGNVTTLKGTFENAFGNDAKGYIVSFLEDINGNQESGRDEDIFSRATKRYKVAAVAANLQVAALQPISYVRMLHSMDLKYLAKGLLGSNKKGRSDAKKYSGIAVWKEMSLFDTNVSKGLDKMISQSETPIEKVVEKTMHLAGLMDDITWGSIWNACKAEVRDNTKLEGEALNEATAKRFREIVYTTQVVDSTMTRSTLMRDKSQAVQWATSFMSEPTVAMNMLTDAYMNYHNEFRKTGSRGAAFKKYGKVILRASFTYILGAAVEGAFRTAFAKLRDTDKDGDELIEALWKEFFEQLNPLANLPIFRDFVSIWQGYSVERPDMQFAEYLKKAVTGFESGGLTYKTFYRAIQALSYGSGLPISNALREVKMIWNDTIALMYPDLKWEE